METTAEKYPIVKDTLSENGVEYNRVFKPRKKGKLGEVGITVPSRGIVVPISDSFSGYFKDHYPQLEIVNLWAHTDVGYCIYDITGQWFAPVRKQQTKK